MLFNLPSREGIRVFGLCAEGVLNGDANGKGREENGV